MRGGEEGHFCWFLISFDSLLNGRVGGISLFPDACDTRNGPRMSQRRVHSGLACGKPVFALPYGDGAYTDCVTLTYRAMSCKTRHPF